MTEAEAQDLAKLKAEQAARRELTFSMCRDILRMGEAELKTIGQRTIEGALRSAIEHGLKECDKLAKAFIRKYPDER